MAASDREIRLAGTVIPAKSHICAFFHNKEEEHRTLLPFVVDGLAQGDKVVRVVPETGREEIRRRLRDDGVDVDDAEERGQLEVLAWPKIVLRDGVFDAKNALELIEDALDAAHRQGYSRARVFGDWALLHRLYAEDFISLEARLNATLEKYEDPVICAYDLSCLCGTAVVDAMRTHPIAIVGGILQQNPFYVSPQQVMEELRNREERAKAASGRQDTVHN